MRITKPISLHTGEAYIQILGSDFMLEVACERAQSVLLDQVHFSLSAEKYQQFTDLLDTPTESNDGLQRLMSIKPVWNKDEA